jgi:hypothetical protein
MITQRLAEPEMVAEPGFKIDAGKRSDPESAMTIWETARRGALFAVGQRRSAGPSQTAWRPRAAMMAKNMTNTQESESGEPGSIGVRPAGRSHPPPAIQNPSLTVHRAWIRT